MMLFMSFIPFENDKKLKLISTITEINEGNRKLREKFIQDSIPFIIKTASKAVGKYVDINNQEEYSIALMAFNESINNYDRNKNDNFWSYSDLIIRRKIIDYYRVNRKHNKVYPFTFFENLDEMIEEKYSHSHAVQTFNDVDTNDELELFKVNLKTFGIGLDDLISRTPKHKDSIKLYIKVARLISDDDKMYKNLIRKKTVPITEIVKKMDIHPKTLEKNRKFIIAICLILKSDLDIMKSFIDFTEKEGSKK